MTEPEPEPPLGSLTWMIVTKAMDGSDRGTIFEIFKDHVDVSCILLWPYTSRRTGAQYDYVLVTFKSARNYYELLFDLNMFYEGRILMRTGVLECFEGNVETGTFCRRPFA